MNEKWLCYFNVVNLHKTVFFIKCLIYNNSRCYGSLCYVCDMSPEGSFLCFSKILK
jgi:hypothetical protein